MGKGWPGGWGFLFGFFFVSRYGICTIELSIGVGRGQTEFGHGDGIDGGGVFCFAFLDVLLESLGTSTEHATHDP